MSTTVRDLLQIQGFRLSVIAGAGAAELDLPITWVHSSDLLDPAQWLSEGQLLLTNGTQFAPDLDEAAATAYVGQLRQRGVSALGFATAVVHEVVPASLVAACDAMEFPLVEVGGRTPFIGIIRHVADAIAREASARLSWSLDAQRAVARAAVGADGLGEIMRVLAERMSSWVALYDSVGGRVRVPGLPPTPEEMAAPLAFEVEKLLKREQPAVLKLESPRATVQTIGQPGRLRGALVVGAVPTDAAESDLVGSVIALASIALEQQRTLDAARRRIRTGVLELLRSGAPKVADRTARAVWGPLPKAPLRVGVIPGPFRGQSVLDELEPLVLSLGQRLFFGELGEDIVLLGSSAALAQLDGMRGRHSLALGLSREVPFSAVDDGIAEARDAAGRADAGGPPVAFDEWASRGIFGFVRASGGQHVANVVMAPMAALPADERERLLLAGRVWLEANGAWDPAARTLGIHRHTLKARIDRLGTILALDLAQFSGRAELWAVLELAD